MRPTFPILVGFLERAGDEVEGRQLPEPPPATQAKLQDLARGKLPRAEQGELLSLLNRNPQWVARLAREVKALRDGND